MLDIIVAFPRIGDARNLQKVLGRNGYEVNAVCDSGRKLIAVANELDGGIIICGYQFSDMLYREVYGYLPKGFAMVLVASPERLEYCTEKEIRKVEMPLHVGELLAALSTIEKEYSIKRKKERARPKFRSEAEQRLIDEAKALLMEMKHMTENEAHRYLQKLSMDSGNSLVESAGMFLDIHRG